MSDFLAEQVRRTQVAANYRRMARVLYDEAKLAFSAGWEAPGAVAKLAARRAEEAADSEMRNPRPVGLP